MSEATTFREQAQTEQEESPEVCVSAAIQVSDGEVFKGRRHNDCALAVDAANVSLAGSVQGFVTSRGNFVTRSKGLELQKAAGIKSRSLIGYQGGELQSIDLY